MRTTEEVVSNNWWFEKCTFISKYILSCCFYIHIIIFVSLAIVELRFSVVYKDQCSIDDRIILYLFIIGIIQIIYSTNGILLIIFSFLYEKYRYMVPFFLICFIIHQILLIFLIIWFLVGNYLVFHIKNDFQYTNSFDIHTYCDYTLYQTAFWTIISYYILIILLSIFLILSNRKWLKKLFKKPIEINKDSSEC
jgi:hypothetical protein